MSRAFVHLLAKALRRLSMHYDRLNWRMEDTDLDEAADYLWYAANRLEDWSKR